MFPTNESIEGINVNKVLGHSRALLALAGALLASQLALGQPAPEILPDQHNRTDSGAANAATIDAYEFPGYLPRLASWSPTADAIFLRRSRADSQRLISNQATGQVVLDASFLEFQHEINPRLQLSRPLGNGHGIELSYFGIYNWNSRTHHTGDLVFHGPGFTLGVNPASFDVAYSSRMHSGEVNLGRPISQRIFLTAGLRYLHFNDKLLAQEFTTPFAEVLRVNTQNNLYGGQLGGRMLLVDIEGRLRLESTLNFGLYANQSRQHTSTSFLGPPVGAEIWGTAFHAQIGLAGMYRMTDHIVLRFGYQFMWLSGIALATHQIPVSDLGASTAAVSTSDLFLDGAHVGLEFIW